MNEKGLASTSATVAGNEQRHSTGADNQETAGAQAKRLTQRQKRGQEEETFVRAHSGRTHVRMNKEGTQKS